MLITKYSPTYGKKILTLFTEVLIWPILYPQCTLATHYHLIFGYKSLKKPQKLGTDFTPDDGNEEIRLELPKETHIANDQVC